MQADCPLAPGSRVYAYARHSPGENQTIHSQVKAIRDYCKANGLALVHVFIDEARKGSTTTGRDEFLSMVDAAHQKPKPVEGIVLWALDRFSRDYNLAQFYKADLRLMGYEIVSVTEPLPEGLPGRLLEAVKDLMAEEELRKNSRAIKRGLDYLREKGCAPTGFPPQGLKAKHVIIDHYASGEPRYGRVWEPDPDTWPLVLLAWRMRLEGATLNEIHAAAPLFTNTQTWSKFFCNEAYLRAGACTQEEWNTVQAMRRPRTGGAYPRRKGSPYLLSSPDFQTLCAYCGGPISGSKTIYTRKNGERAEWPYYVCASKKRNWGSCEAKALKESVVNQAILDTVLGQILVPDYLADLVAETNRLLGADQHALDSKLSGLRKQLAGLDSAISNLLDIVETDGFGAAQERLSERRAERFAIERELAQLTQSRPSALHVDELAIRAAIAEMRRSLSSKNTEAAKRVLGCLVDHIVLSKDGGEIHYHQPLFGSQEPPLLMWLPIAKASFCYSEI